MELPHKCKGSLGTRKWRCLSTTATFFYIHKITKTKIETVESGKMILQERFRHKWIFLVLDIVNKLESLNALCGSCKWFG